jgi:hypothetical protein
MRVESLSYIQPQAPVTAVTTAQGAKARVEELKRDDRDVKTHELNHRALPGKYEHAGQVQYAYKRGPDGKMYVASGGVAVDLSVTSNPDETMKKMQEVKSYALGPANPSFKDFVIASRAILAEQQAKIDKVREEYSSGPQTSPTVSVYA